MVCPLPPDSIRVGLWPVTWELIRRGADVNKFEDPDAGFGGAAGAIDYNGTSLLYAIYHGKTKLVKRLLDLGADVETAGRVNGRREIVMTDKTFPLLLAAEKGKIDCIRLLMAHGANSASRDTRGYTALHGAALRATPEALKVLIQDCGADKAVQSTDGTTPLHVAAGHGKITTMRALLKHGADMNTPTIDGQTPLHFAARNAQWDGIQLLLDRGAKTNIRATDSQLTALDMAQAARKLISDRLWTWGTGRVRDPGDLNNRFRGSRRPPPWGCGYSPSKVSDLDALFDRLGA